MFSLHVKRHFETEHENVLSVMYVNPPKDIKSSYFRKVTAVNWCNVLWLMVYSTVLCKMPRRNRISLEKRERIIRAFEDTNEDYLMVADTIGVNRSTARSIVARYIHVREGQIAERPRGGANNVRVDNEMKDCLNDILNDNCMLTLAQINQELIEG